MPGSAPGRVNAVLPIAHDADKSYNRSALASQGARYAHVPVERVWTFNESIGRVWWKGEFDLAFPSVRPPYFWLGQVLREDWIPPGARPVPSWLAVPVDVPLPIERDARQYDPCLAAGRCTCEARAGASR